MKLTIRSLMLPAGIWIAGLTAHAQGFRPSSIPETLYPTVGTSTYNLDRNETKYLSNHSAPGTGALAGYAIQLSGWSTDSGGGFSYGIANTVAPYAFIGRGTEDIPNARDVQVGHMKNGMNNYIVASYYDVAEEQYAYDLYSLLAPSPAFISITKLYTYHFENPDFSMPAHIPTTGYSPIIPGAAPGTYPAPDMHSKMSYNRISMDVNAPGNHVAMVMTNNDNSYLYVAAGEIGPDTIIFSPNLPGVTGYSSTSVGGGSETPISMFTCTYAAPWISGAGGTYWDYFDAPTGLHVRYYPGTDQYDYSYYPLDRGIFVTTTDGVGTVISKTSSAYRIYNPLIGIMPHSFMFTPGRNQYFNTLWPDVCFNGDAIRIVFYANNPDPTFDAFSGQPNGAEDLYVTEKTDFSYLYDYIGAAYVAPGGIGGPAGPNHVELTTFNTFDKKPIRESPTSCYGTYLAFGPGWTPFDYESLCKSLPLVPGEEIRAKIDAPDNGTNHYAITFAYSGVPSGGYSAFYPPSTERGSSSYPSPDSVALFVPVHDPDEFGKKNIYVRYDGFNGQAILTNDKLVPGHAPINTHNNISPSIAYNPFNTSEFAVAWVSETAAVGPGNLWSYIAVQLNSSVPYGATGFRTSLSDYLRIPQNSKVTNYSGQYPLVTLSKRNDGLPALYTSFAQEEASSLIYSIQHKSHPWTTASWRPLAINEPSLQAPITISPNPFQNTLHLQANEKVSISLTDIVGKKIFSGSGLPADLNVDLDRIASELIPGIYLADILSHSGYKISAKLVKDQ